MKTLFIDNNQITELSTKLNMTSHEQFICGTRRAYPILNIGLSFQGGTIAGMTVSINRRMQLLAWNKFQADIQAMGIQATA